MKKYKWQIIGGGVLLAIAVIAVSILVAKNKKNKRTYMNFDVIGTAVEFAETSEVHYLPSGKGVFRYTRDGAEIIDKKGKSVVTVSYNMNKPSGATCGNAAAIGEIGGKSLVIVDNKGNVTPVTTAYPIVMVKVASQGVTAVLMNNGNEDFIELYKSDGTSIASMNTHVSTSGFPVDIALSNDGSKLVTAYTSFKGEKMQSQLSFYNFGNVGGNYVDGLVAVELYKDEMIPDVEFVNNDTVVAFGDKAFRIYDMEEIADLKKQVDVKEPIRAVASSPTNVALIVESKEKGGNYLIRVYNLEGKTVDEKSITEGYDHFQIEGSDVVLFNDKEVYIYRIGGRDKIRVEMRKNLSYVAAVDGVNEFLFVGETYLERVRLVGEKR
ncbi:MAG: hypothetical protein J5643_08180 [Lachnospiraceae bacterium]|nr:hypothetical protein [Lachnospiraceae bacterium]